MARLLAAFCLVAGLAHGALITLKPPAGKTGADKVFVLINGAYVPNEDYVEVAKAIQAASDFKLYVAIPSFLLNCPNPGQIDSGISGGVSELKKLGFSGSNSDVIVGGHSLGGIFSQSAVVKGGYAGLVLFGSYLSSSPGVGYGVGNYPKPALTLAGELDGLTRITRIAQSWIELQDLVAAKGDEAHFTHPVIAMEGVTHSQFCSNDNVTSFGMKDKCPEVSMESAHASIGSNVAAFMTVTFASGDVAAAKAKIGAGIKYTEGLLSGYVNALKSTRAGELCEHGQEQEVSTSKTTADVKVTSTSNFASFDATNPSIDGHNVRAVQEVQTKLNPADLSTSDLSSTYVNCKIKTAAALAQAAGAATPAQDSNTCKSVNEYAINVAMELVSAKTKERYSYYMKPLVVEDDVVYSTGLTWQAAGLNFDMSSNTKSVAISSPRLTASLSSLFSPGSQLCKYLTPDRVIEYMMTDGLPGFDQCPKKSEASLIV